MHSSRIHTGQGECADTSIPQPEGSTPPLYHTPCEQTDACENITFPQLRLRAVTIECF